MSLMLRCITSTDSEFTEEDGHAKIRAYQNRELKSMTTQGLPEYSKTFGGYPPIRFASADSVSITVTGILNV